MRGWHETDTCTQLSAYVCACCIVDRVCTKKNDLYSLMHIVQSIYITSGTTRAMELQRDEIQRHRYLER